MRIPIDAVRSREGAAFLGAAGVVLAITLGILTDTVRDTMHQSERTEAIRLFLAGRGEARAKLLEFENDVDALLALGAFELGRSDLDAQRLEAAESFFNRAFQLDPTSTPAVLGRTIVLLRKADSRSDLAARRSAAEEAGQLLTGAMDAADPDVVYLQGAIDILSGELDEAKQRLDDESRLATGPGMAARYWNRGVAAIVARDGDALQRFLLGYLMRPWPLPDLQQAEQPELLRPRYEPAAMLTLAYRVTLDPRIDPEGLSARCDEVARALQPNHRGGINQGPFSPSAEDSARVRNALGLALIGCQRLEEAVAQFELAAKRSPGELLYKRNLAQARYLQAQASPEEGRQQAYGLASREFHLLAKALQGQEGREDQLELAMINAVAITLESGDMRVAIQSMQGARGLYSDEAKFQRDMGAVLDHAGNAACVRHYMEAIKLDHPEARDLQRRVRRYDR